MHFDTLNIIILFFLGIITSFISTNTGGGALVSIPALIFLGFPPINAIATVKLGHLGTTLSGLIRFHKNKTVKYKTAFPAAITASLGAILGANLLIITPQPWLTKIIGILILTTLILIWFQKNGLLPYKQHKKIHLLGYFLFFFIGVLGGVLGASGTFSTFILLTFFGLTYVEAAGTRKVVGLSMNIVALIIYAIHHLVYYKYGLVLFLGTIIGSYLGASFGIKKGNQWIRIAFSIVTLILAIRLLF